MHLQYPPVRPHVSVTQAHTLRLVDAFVAVVVAITEIGDVDTHRGRGRTELLVRLTGCTMPLVRVVETVLVVVTDPRGHDAARVVVTAHLPYPARDWIGRLPGLLVSYANARVGGVREAVTVQCLRPRGVEDVQKDLTPVTVRLTQTPARGYKVLPHYATAGAGGEVGRAAEQHAVFVAGGEGVKALDEVDDVLDLRFTLAAHQVGEGGGVEALPPAELVVDRHALARFIWTWHADLGVSAVWQGGAVHRKLGARGHRPVTPIAYLFAETSTRRDGLGVAATLRRVQSAHKSVEVTVAHRRHDVAYLLHGLRRDLLRGVSQDVGEGCVRVGGHVDTLR